MLQKAEPTELRLARRRGPRRSRVAVPTKALALALIFLGLGGRQLLAQKTAAAVGRALPSAEKVVDNYLKAIGGKKRVLLIRDTAYEWTVRDLNSQATGTARTQVRIPSSVRTELRIGNGQLISAANTSSAWVYGVDGVLHTLTGPEAAAAKLQALLDANHLLNYKKLNVLARVVSVSDPKAEPAYAVEFSMRSGARLRYWFNATDKLLIKIEDEARHTTTRFSDYRRAGGADLLEPHSVDISSVPGNGTETGSAGELTFSLQRVSYNAGLADSFFDPPLAKEALDVPALLREVGRNQDAIEKRVTEYAFMQKETLREISDKGEVRKETVKVFEVFPVAHRAPIKKLISENGVALAGEQAAKEDKRVKEEFEKAERDQEKDEAKAERRRAERQKQDDDPGIPQFLKACDFISPRRELFRERDAIVFDFRPRAGFKPANRQESLISKLVGVVWIDPVDKQIMRLEAKLAEGFKMAGGVLLSLRPGAAFVMEQTRMVEGVWLPRQAQVNLSVKVLLFAGGDINRTIEWSDYKHFKGDVTDYKLDAPKVAEPNKKP